MTNKKPTSSAGTRASQPVTSNAQPFGMFSPAKQTIARPRATSSAVQTGSVSTVVVSAGERSTVSIPYNADRETARRENLRANGISQETAASTDDSR